MLSYKQSNLRSVLLTCSTSLKKVIFFSCFSFSPPARVQYSLLGCQGVNILLFLKEQNVQNNLPSSIRALFLMAILYSGVSAIAATCKVMQRCVKEFSCSYILLYFPFLYSFVCPRGHWTRGACIC